jgi:hypothetical protein
MSKKAEYFIKQKCLRYHRNQISDAIYDHTTRKLHGYFPKWPEALWESQGIKTSEQLNTR